MNISVRAKILWDKCWIIAKHIYKKEYRLIISKLYKYLGKKNVHCISEYGRFKALPNLKERFVQQAKEELDAFFLSNGSLRVPFHPSPKLTVLVLLYNKSELTYMCLKTLASLGGELGDEGMEVLIIDNASTDETRLLLSRVDGARILYNKKNVGFLKGCNQAIELVDSEFLLFLNNDTLVYPGTIKAALENFLANELAGAVGARIMLLDGTLQEAGSLIWSNGGCLGYARGEHKTAGEAMWRRKVDYCSGAFLMTRTALFNEVGGFDEMYLPAYYEESDYCVELAKRGYDIIYEPRAVITHFEYGSSLESKKALDLMAKNQEKFALKHKDYLQHKYPPFSDILRARTTNIPHKRILFIDDRVPHKYWGAGFPRTNRVVELLHGFGFETTIYVTDFPDALWKEAYSDIPREVEIIDEGSCLSLRSFMEERKDLYDVVWVCRPNNMEDLQRYCSDLLEKRKYLLVYDAEAIFSEREALEKEITGRNIPRRTKRTFDKEMRLGRTADLIVAITEKDADKWKQYTGRTTLVIGHDAQIDPTTNKFEERKDILFLGSMHAKTSPNTDSLVWFMENVFPKMKKAAGGDFNVTVVGYIEKEVKKMITGKYQGLCIVGRVPDIKPYLGSHRCMIIPTRYASGIPQKAFDAAIFGIPTVCSELIARQLDWKDGEQAMVAPTDTGELFSKKCITLYYERNMWQKVRDGALDYMKKYDSEGGIKQKLNIVLKEMENTKAGKGLST